MGECVRERRELRRAGKGGVISWRIMSTWLPECSVNETTVLDASLDYNLLTPHRVCIWPPPSHAVFPSLLYYYYYYYNNNNYCNYSEFSPECINIKYLHVTSMVLIVVQDSPQ